MNNCVIRKLKESINDDNLYALDEIVIESTAILDQQYTNIGIAADRELDITLLDDDIYFINSVVDMANGHVINRAYKYLPGSTQTIQFTGSGRIKINHKFNLTYLNIWGNGGTSTNTKYFLGIENINTLCLNNRITGDIKGLMSLNRLETLELNNNTISGDITDLLVKNYNTLTRANMINNYNISLDITRVNTDKILNNLDYARYYNISLYGNINNIPSNYKVFSLCTSNNVNVTTELTGTLDQAFFNKIMPLASTLPNTSIRYNCIYFMPKNPAKFEMNLSIINNISGVDRFIFNSNIIMSGDIAQFNNEVSYVELSNNVNTHIVFGTNIIRVNRLAGYIYILIHLLI